MKPDKFKSLGNRLNFWIIPLAALVLMSVLGLNYLLSRFLLEEYVDSLSRATASSTVRKIETIFNTVSISADSLSSLVSSVDINDQQIQQTIKTFINTNNAIFGMAVALEPNKILESRTNYSSYFYREKNNQLVSANLSDENYHFQSQPWYNKPKQLNKPVWSEPYFDQGGGDAQMITYSTPIYLPISKTFAGVSTADIQLSWLDEVIDEMKIGDYGYGFILTGNDVIIAQPDSNLNLVKMTKDIVAPDKWQHYVNSKTLSSDIHFTSPCSRESASNNCRFTIQSLSNSGWKVVIVLPEKELSAKITELTIKITIISLLGLIILFVVINFITQYFTKPLAMLASATRDIGAGNLDKEIPLPVHKDEIGGLTDDFNSMRNSLQSYIKEVQLATAKQQKLESEIQIAKDIQMSMVPGSGRAFISNDVFQLFALLRPARAVGGDLYYFTQTDDTLNFIIGDVSDKGVPAALFMAKTITLYTRALRDKLAPGETLTMMNDVLIQNNDACMFVTALCGTINLKTGAIVMANAGHMPPIVQDLQDTHEHDVEAAIALGLMDDTDYPDTTFQLDQMSSIFMYTDGISEAHDKNNKQYSDEKLIDYITQIDTSHAEKAGNDIIKSVDEFAAGTDQFDDITLLIIRLESHS